MNNTFELKNIFFKHNDNETHFGNADIKFNVNRHVWYPRRVWNRENNTVDKSYYCLLPATGNMYIDGNKINLFENNFAKYISFTTKFFVDCQITENIIYGEKKKNISGKCRAAAKSTYI